MRTIKEIRVKNINLLADEGGRGDLASKLGYKDTIYINQLCKGFGSFGDGTARKIEKLLSLQKGWMDLDREIELVGASTNKEKIKIHGPALTDLIGKIENLPEYLIEELNEVCENHIRLVNKRNQSSAKKRAI